MTIERPMFPPTSAGVHQYNRRPSDRPQQHRPRPCTPLDVPKLIELGARF